LILLLTIAAAMATRAAVGKSLGDLAKMRLRGETVLLILLVSQVSAPLVSLSGAAGRVAFWIWLATFPALIAVTFLNRDQPGMILVAAGLGLNLAVILANLGMPVADSAVAVVRPGLAHAVIPPSDFVHVRLSSATVLPWLADIVPLPGPSGLRSIVSPGDLLLFAGIYSTLVLGRSRREPTPATMQ
jgi:hypothetical protein